MSRTSREPAGSGGGGVTGSPGRASGECPRTGDWGCPCLGVTRLMGSLVQLSLRCLTHALVLVHNCRGLAAVPALIHVSINSAREALFPAKANKQDLLGQGYSIPGKAVARDIVIPRSPDDPTAVVSSSWQVWGTLGQNVPAPRGTAHSSAHQCHTPYSQKWKGMGECIV